MTYDYTIEEAVFSLFNIVFVAFPIVVALLLCNWYISERRGR